MAPLSAHEGGANGGNYDQPDFDRHFTQYFETYLIFVLKIIQKVFSIFGHQQQTTTGTVPLNCQIYVTCPYR